MRPFWAPEVEVAIDVELAATIEAWPWAAGWRTLSSCQRLEGDRNGQAWIAFTDAWMAQAFAIAVGGSVSPPGWTVDLGHVRGAGRPLQGDVYFPADLLRDAPRLIEAQ